MNDFKGQKMVGGEGVRGGMRCKKKCLKQSVRGR